MTSMLVAGDESARIFILTLEKDFLIALTYTLIYRMIYSLKKIFQLFENMCLKNGRARVHC